MFHLTWRTCQNRQYHLICRFSWLLGSCPKPPALSIVIAQSQCCFSICLYQFRGFGLLAWENKNVVLGGTGERGVYLLGDFPCGKGNFFSRCEEWANFWLLAPIPPVVEKILDDLSHLPELRWFAWLYKSLKSGNGTKISDEKWRLVKSTFLENKKW